MYRIICKYNLMDLWNDEKLIYHPPQSQERKREVTQVLSKSAIRRLWNKHIYKIVHAIEEKEWIANMKKRPKLRSYILFKKKLEMETYLISENNKTARYILTSIRTGTNILRIDAGRWAQPREAVQNRVCRVCLSGEVEDERHFIFDCKAYDNLRKSMISNLSSLHIDLSRLGSEEKWILLMSSKTQKFAKA
jgi:hypothetical protein